jgi:Transposase IS66 family
MFNLSDIHKITSVLSPSGLIDQFKKLLGAYEEKVEEVDELKKENVALKDRLRKLIGEQEIPKFKDKKGLHHQKPSKKDRKKNWKKKSKNSDVKIDREEKCPADKDKLPSDAEFKGHREITVQNIILKTDNVKFKIERWYSPSLRKYFEGKIPSSFQGSQFGPELRSFIIMLYVGLRSTENKIEKFLADLGVSISAGEISNILTNIDSKFSDEMNNAKVSGIKMSPALNIDATGMYVRSESCFNLCHGNKYFSYHSTVQTRSRLDAIKCLIMSQELIYLIDEDALLWLEKRKFKKNQKIYIKLKNIMSKKEYSEDEIDALILSFKIADTKSINFIKTSALLSAWKKNLLGVIPEGLISDSAGEYREILDWHQECWIHELRHYREIKISSEYVREELDLFFEQAWDLFDLRESYKFFPSIELRQKIELDFKALFEKKWNSFMINHCRDNTLSRKENLLTFLDHPTIPIHNNQAESYIREKVIRRKISGGHKNLKGAAAGNLWISLYQTVRKNGLSFFLYLQDRFKELNLLPQLSTIIENQI